MKSTNDESKRKVHEITSEIGHIKHTINDLVSIVKLSLVQTKGDEKGEKTNDGKYLSIYLILNQFKRIDTPQTN